MRDTTTAARGALVLRLRAAGCVFAEDEAELLLTTGRERGLDPVALDALVQRRVAGEPLEHLLGWVDVDGLRVAVAPGVFVPRRRSLLLARLALASLPHRDAPPPTVLELCCGAAAIGALLLRDAPDRALRLVAADIDPAAVACARRNVPGALVVEGDLFDPLPHALAGAVDVVVANAPYVPTAAIATMPAEARDHEHRVALDGGADGLDVQRRIADGVGRWLAPGGTVIVETSAAQAPASAALFTSRGFTATVVRGEDVDGTAVLAHAPIGSTDTSTDDTTDGAPAGGA